MAGEWEVDHGSAGGHVSDGFRWCPKAAHPTSGQLSQSLGWKFEFEPRWRAGVSKAPCICQVGIGSSSDNLWGGHVSGVQGCAPVGSFRSPFQFELF